jgi:hypothetical protein
MPSMRTEMMASDASSSNSVGRPFLGPSVSSVVPVFTFARTNASIEAAELSGMAARRMRHHDAANRPERRPLAAVHSSLGSGARRDGGWGALGIGTGLPLPRPINVVGRLWHLPQNA